MTPRKQRVLDVTSSDGVAVPLGPVARTVP